jgi:hypothetical protein
MSATATRPAGGLGVLPIKEFFTLDVRSLALMRVALALMVLLDWIDRLPDLRAHYSDEGIVPREILTLVDRATGAINILPISVHFFSGSVWFQAVLAVLALLFGLLLLVGYRTPLSCLVSWFLLISVHARNPAVMQGGDHLIRMLLFWGIFLPLGARWSIDAARDEAPPREPRVLSPATFAYIVQLCLVYFFAAAWKWDPVWRTEGTAVYLALHVDSFTTRFAYLLLQYPELLRYVTYATLWTETLGPVLLFLPFNVAWQRLLAISVFILFHLGLALSMELGNFPWVCMAAWLALLPGSFWDRLRTQFEPAGRGLTILFDPGHGWASTGTAWLPTFLLLWNASSEASGQLARVRNEGGWGVRDASGQEEYGADALATLVAASPVFSPLARLFRSAPGRWLARLVGGRRGGERRARTSAPARAPRWAPPGGAVVNAVVLFLIVYLVLLNTRNFIRTRNQAFPDPNRPSNDNQAILPNHAYPFSMALGIDQGWGVFAPRPGMFVGWYFVVGETRKGKRFDLLDGNKVDDESITSKPSFPAGVDSNGRWRKIRMNLAMLDMQTGARAYPYLLAGMARFAYREWNSKHGPDEQISKVEIVWWMEETRPPNEKPPTPQRIVLLRYKPDALPESQWEYWSPRKHDPGRKPDEIVP